MIEQPYADDAAADDHDAGVGGKFGHERLLSKWSCHSHRGFARGWQERR